MNRTTVAVGAGLIVGAALVSVGSEPATTYGYVVFSPTANLSPIAPSGDLDLSITGCQIGDRGLEVRGRVDPPGSAPGQVLVTSGPDTIRGVSVGAALVAQASLWGPGTPGDFIVVVPWATLESRFAALQDPSAGPGGRPGRRGASSVESCPEAGYAESPASSRP